MKIHNLLPHLLKNLELWEKRPNSKNIESGYIDPIRHLVEDMFADFRARTNRSIADIVADLDWKTYRANALELDPIQEEQRLRKQITEVESLVGETLTGQSVLLGAFTAMDGYARFHKGSHNVFLGVDESHNNPGYLDILVSHELTHVAREAIPEVWQHWNLNPQMTHDELAATMPVLEHLFGEGLSCIVSELIHPELAPYLYVYQTPENFSKIIKHAAAIDQRVHQAVADPNFHYASLYNFTLYNTPVPMPQYSHYVWAWLWVKHLLQDIAKGDIRKLLRLNLNDAHGDLKRDALHFSLQKAVKSLK